MIDLNNLPGTRITQTYQINVSPYKYGPDLGSMIVRSREMLARKAAQDLAKNDTFFNVSGELRVGASACHIVAVDFIAISRTEFLQTIAKAYAAGAHDRASGSVISGF